MDKQKKKDSVEYILYPHEKGDSPDTGGQGTPDVKSQNYLLKSRVE